MTDTRHVRFRYGSLEELCESMEELGIFLPVSSDPGILFEKVKIGSAVIGNRFLAQPMEGCDGTELGAPGELTIRRYLRFAASGAGVLWLEATAVCAEGRGNPRQLMLNDRTAGHLRAMLDEAFMHAARTAGSVPYSILQLTHSGRYSKPEAIIAERVPGLDERIIGDFHVITDEELDQLVERYAEAAALAAEIGFDAVDVKSCHRYLVSELLGARERDGRYGGDFGRRSSFVLAVIDRIRERVGDSLDIAVRMSAYDGIPYPHGFGMADDGSDLVDNSEPVRLARMLADKGVKIVNVTAGNPYYNPHINRPYDIGPYLPREHQLEGVSRLLELARDVKNAVPGCTVVSSGLSWLREYGAAVAAGCIEKGWFDMAGFGRQMFAYPEFIADLRCDGVMKRERCCIACGKCSGLMRLGSKAGCVVRDRDVYAPLYRDASAGKPSVDGTHIADHV